ncbi:DNA/RNA polymerase superfamily protein [Gossypium australe]|uniref:DNA/RNA polymerase superfamily protein n=1 Tax=Gossypium australe TaxID=47621 RepID=A0A5B6X1F6_9ROSI|nr:DNA/RNA polymerase superfamily protein [Gossypium australe]
MSPRRFLKGFSTTTTQLTRLLWKDMKFHWIKECQHSLDELKKALTEAQVLSQLESKVEYIKGKEITYASLQLKPHENNYPTNDLELVVVVLDLKIWSHYLYREKCHIFSDHKSLKYLLSLKEINLCQLRWIKLLKDTDLTIEYHLGKTNVVSNALSRKTIMTLASLRASVCLEKDRSISLG